MEMFLLFCGLNLVKQAINMRGGNAVNNSAWESAKMLLLLSHYISLSLSLFCSLPIPCIFSLALLMA